MSLLADLLAWFGTTAGAVYWLLIEGFDRLEDWAAEHRAAAAESALADEDFIGMLEGWNRLGS